MFPHRFLLQENDVNSKPGPLTTPRRTFLGGALGALLSSPRQVRADAAKVPNNPFILLLNGVYRPVLQGPNLGLPGVNLSDGSYSVTKIYPVFGISNDTINETSKNDKPIGNFYVQFNGNLCAYDLPGGAIAMQFLPAPAGAPPGFNGFVPFPDGVGGNYLEGTFELTILEATGVYSAFKGGHNHMVDRLHQLVTGSFDEFCFCNISQYQFP